MQVQHGGGSGWRGLWYALFMAGLIVMAGRAPFLPTTLAEKHPGRFVLLRSVRPDDAEHPASPELSRLVWSETAHAVYVPASFRRRSPLDALLLVESAAGPVDLRWLRAGWAGSRLDAILPVRLQTVEEQGNVVLQTPDGPVTLKPGENWGYRFPTGKVLRVEHLGIYDEVLRAEDAAP